jgi:hypothetical protein
MRTLLLVVMLALPFSSVQACSCVGGGQPCQAAGISAAVFTGTVVDIANPAPPVFLPGTGGNASRRSADSPPSPLPRQLRTIRFRVADVLTGLAPGQREIEILTGMGGGDCGYPFDTSQDYVIYAHRNSDGHLETGICSRTRLLSRAAEDIQYFHNMAGAPATSEMRVMTGYPGTPAKSGITILAESGGSRYSALTNAAGQATFTGLPPGEYTIHSAADGDLADDPKVQLYAKGCRDLTLFRTLRISGRVVTLTGFPAARVQVEFRSVQGTYDDGRMTAADGSYELRIPRPGRYYLGVNLNHTATRDTPYPRWFYPGTADQALAAQIDFSGTPEDRKYDFALPDRQATRVIRGVVFGRDGQPTPRAVLSVVDSSHAVIAQAFADKSGQFAMDVFGSFPYRLHAVWPGNTTGEAASAPPVDIKPGSDQLDLRLILTQPGNSYLEERRAPTPATKP